MMTVPRQPASRPPLAGIDTAEGLKRVEQDQDFYLSILFKVRDRQANFVERVRRLLSESGDRGAAQREAHTLKSLAAAIGAKELSAVAGDLERVVGAGADIPECLRLLENVGMRLSGVLTVISGLEHLRASEPVAASKLDGKELATLIDEARILLAAFNVDAEKPVKQLCGALSGSVQAERAKRLRELVSHYDYESAKAELEALAREIYDKSR